MTHIKFHDKVQNRPRQDGTLRSKMACPWGGKAEKCPFAFQMITTPGPQKTASIQRTIQDHSDHPRRYDPSRINGTNGYGFDPFFKEKLFSDQNISGSVCQFIQQISNNDNNREINKSMKQKLKNGFYYLRNREVHNQRRESEEKTLSI